VACPARRTDRSSAYFLVPSARQWLAPLAGWITLRLTSSFLPLVSGLPGSPDGSLIDLLPRSFRSLVACPAHRTERSSAYFLVSSARQWLTQLAGRITHRLTSSFLPLISGLPGLPDRLLIGLLPRSFRSSVACTARRTERSSAYFLVPSAHQWLAQLAGRSAHRLTSLFLPLISGLPGSRDRSLIGLLPRSFRSSVACPPRRTDRSSAYFLVPSALQWLAQLAGRSANRLTSSFLPLISGLPGSPDGALIGLLPRFFRSSVACPARGTDRSSAYFLVPSAHQWLARLTAQIAHRLTSSFLLLVSGLPGFPDGALIGLLPRSFHSSVACLARQTERSLAYFLVSFAYQWVAQLAGQITRRLTSSFLPLISGLPGSPDRSLIGLLPRSFRSSVACPARRTDRSSAYFLVPSTHQWLARLAARSAHRLTSSFLPLISGLPGSRDRSLVGLLPRSFRSSVACLACRTDRSSAYFLVPSVRQWLAPLAGRITHRLTSLFLLLVSGLPSLPDRSLIVLLPRSFCSSVACPAHRTDRSSAYFLVPSAHQWLTQLAGRITHRLTSSFLPLISGLPGSPDGSLIDLLPRFFRLSVACPARRTERSSAYLLVSSARQLLAHLAGQIAHRLTSSFLPLISGFPGSPDGSLIVLLPRIFRSSMACRTARRTDHSSAYFLVPSAHQSLAGWIAHRLTSLFLPLVTGFPDGSSDGLLIGLIPCSFSTSVAFPTAPQTDCSSAYFLVLPLINGLPDGSLVRLLPRSFCSSMACLTARRMDRSSAYFLIPSACRRLA